MPWRDRVKTPASFRGVPFYVDTSSRTGGRRGVTHEYPFRDKPFREDTGEAARGFSIEGYVIGDDYLDARDALLAALQAYGPGTLVHPYFGALTVAVDSFSARESKQDGGMATFSIEFVETPTAPSQPTATPETGAQLTTAASAARTAISNEFLAVYAPGARMETIADMPRRIALATETALSKVAHETQTAAEIRAGLDSLAANAAALVQEPADILAELVGVLNLFPSGVNAVLEVYDFNPGVRPPSVTSNRVVEQGNFGALQQVTQRLAAVRAAELALTETFESYESAVAARTAITDALDEQAESVEQDATYAALVELRAAVVLAVPGRESDLPRLTPYTPREAVPSLVLSWELYGNVTGEVDILARNAVRHPGFVPGGRELEVLSEA